MVTAGEVWWIMNDKFGNIGQLYQDAPPVTELL